MAEVSTLVQTNPNGLYCEAGDFYVDPWEPVERAVITHAHADHLYAGSRSYLTALPGAALVRARLGPDARIETLEYGTGVILNGVRVSLHPAGHILGSAQVRIKHRGETCVVSGDYKLAPDPTCAAFEPLRCDTFVTESTFGLPIFRWPDQSEVFAEINSWWRGNQDAGKASVLFAYPLGKAQRVLAGIDASIGPIYTHGAVEHFNRIYRDAGVALARTEHATTAPTTAAASAGARPTPAAKSEWSRALILAPPLAKNSAWLRRFGDFSTGFASGWMRIRGTRRRRSIDRGFVLSDHADWPGLARAVEASGAAQVWVTHGYRAVIARWLAAKGLDAHAIETRFEGERDDAAGDLETDTNPEGTET